jgi:lysophospholipase L1-like esterase
VGLCGNRTRTLAALAVAALITAEGLARKDQGYLLLAWPLRRSFFGEQDRLKIYNRSFYESHRDFFEDWPARPELFESDKPEPRYLFKPGLRIALRDDLRSRIRKRLSRSEFGGNEILAANVFVKAGSRLVAALPGERPFWTSNAWGFRGPEFRPRKPRGALRIVCLGASTTEGVQRDLETYPFYLSLELRRRFPGRVVEVINAGHHGQALADHLEMFRRRVRPLRPDVLLLYSVSGDVRFEDFTGPLPCAIGFAGGACWLEALPGPFRHLYRRSAAFVSLAALMGLDSWGPPPASHPFEDSSPKPGAARYEETLRRLVREARSAGSVVVLSSFVTAVREEPECTPADNPVLYNHLRKAWYPLTPRELGRVYGYYNSRTKAVALELGVPFIDAAAEFPTDPRYFPFDIIHLSPEGNRLLARIFARRLAERVLPRILVMSPVRP